MHEGSIAASLIHNCGEIARENGLASVGAVRVLIGRMHHVVPAVLQEQFRLQKKHHPFLSRARLIIQIQEIRVRCRACMGESPIGAADLRCPACGAGDIDMASGMELHIVDITGRKK